MQFHLPRSVVSLGFATRVDRRAVDSYSAMLVKTMILILEQKSGRDALEDGPPAHQSPSLQLCFSIPPPFLQTSLTATMEPYQIQEVEKSAQHPSIAAIHLLKQAHGCQLSQRGRRQQHITACT
eukprot:1151962-Pelagomonas_calceolata.AAC.2